MTPSLSTRLGSLGRTSQALAAVAAALDCQAADTRFLRVFHDLEASRASLHAELAKPLPGDAAPPFTDPVAQLLAECPRQPVCEHSHRDGYFRHGYPFGTMTLACVTSEALERDPNPPFVPSLAQAAYERAVYYGQKPVDTTRPAA